MHTENDEELSDAAEQQVELEQLRRSAELYAEVYEEEQALTEDALEGWPE